MRSQNIKYNSSVGKVGGVSSLLLLLITFLTINPVVSSSAFAEELENNELSSPDGSSEEQSNTTDEAVEDDANYDNQASTQASTFTDSTVTISFSPSEASGSVTPVNTSTGDAAKVDVQATVRVQNSGGYSVYVGSTSNQLKNGSNVIDPVTSATTYAAMPVNRWGYSFRKASSATDKATTDSYSAMPATIRSTAVDSNNATNIKDETRYYMLSFAARIGSDKPAGKYTNSVTMSVVSSPLETTVNNDFGIETMQEMTSAICSGVANGTTAQLKDSRDGKFYWVGKLADGKCWMTQNLDLDLTSGTKLTSDTSDVPAAGYTPNYTTATTISSSTINTSATGQNSWSLGNYRITNPNASSSCGTKKASAADCASQFSAYTTPTSANGDENAHYILGNHYQWNAATAGTGGSITSGTASNSICPKGWKLPTSGTDGEFDALVTALGGTSSTDNVTKAPFYGVRGGYVSQSTSLLFAAAGDSGSYWSSTPISDGVKVYFLYFYGTDNTNPSTNAGNGRNVGASVRCIAR